MYFRGHFNLLYNEVYVGVSDVYLVVIHYLRITNKNHLKQCFDAMLLTIDRTEYTGNRGN